MDANDLYLIVQALRQEIGLENTASDTSKLRGSSQFSKTVQDINLGTGLTMVGNTLNAAGGGVSDGDKGDIMVSLGGTVWTIDNGVVTYAKLQAASGASKLIGSPSTGATFQEITLGSGLSMVGGVLSATGGSGTVTSVSVATANGVSGSVANATTTPVITITLGAITPSSVAATGNVTGVNLSGTNTGDETNATIKTKLGSANSGADGYLLSTDWSTFNSKLSTISGIAAGGELSGTYPNPSLSNSAVIGKLLTGYVSSPGTVSATDSILQAIQKLNGNIGALTTASVPDSTNKRYVTDAQLVVIGNTSGINTGDQTITLTGDVAGSGTGSFAATIANNAVSNAKLATVATSTFKGRATAGAGNVEDLTTAQATALLDVFTSLLKGLVPASGGGTANFLRADGSWAAPSSGVTVNQSYGFTAAY